MEVPVYWLPTPSMRVPRLVRLQRSHGRTSISFALPKPPVVPSSPSFEEPPRRRNLVTTVSRSMPLPSSEHQTRKVPSGSSSEPHSMFFAPASTAF
jgi:hypothetical protein